MPSNTIAASATPPRRCASPSRPIAAVATRPNSGVVRFASIAGPAIAKTRAWVTLKVGVMAMRRPPGRHGRAKRVEDARERAYVRGQPRLVVPAAARKTRMPGTRPGMAPKERAKGRSPTARRAHQPNDQPDWDYQDRAQQEVAPERNDGVEAHVPDVFDQLSNAADDVEGVEPEHLEHEADQDREQHELEDHGQRSSAEKSLDRARRRRRGGLRLVLRHGHGSTLSCCAACRCPAALDSLQDLPQRVEPVGLAWRLVPAQPADARKTHGEARFVPGRTLQSFERDFEHQALVRLVYDLAHRAEPLDGIPADEPVDLQKLLVGEAEIGLADRHQLVAVGARGPYPESVIGVIR